MEGRREMGSLFLFSVSEVGLSCPAGLFVMDGVCGKVNDGIRKKLK